MSPTKIDVNQIKSKSNESLIVKKSIAKNSNKNFYLIENDLELLPVENIIIKKKASSVTVSSKILTAVPK
jgi:3-dehydroquinate synthase class II